MQGNGSEKWIQKWQEKEYFLLICSDAAAELLRTENDNRVTLRPHLRLCVQELINVAGCTAPYLYNFIFYFINEMH